MWKVSCTVYVIFTLNVLTVFCYPYDELMQEQSDDTALVESTIRETRAVRPQSIHDLLKPGVKQAYLHTYGDDPHKPGNLHGYLKKKNDKGDDGYKHFDSFHKKDADKYGFEVHSEYGKLNKAEVDTGAGKKQNKKEEDDGDETKAYEVVEDPESKSSYYSGDDESESQSYADGGSEAEEDDGESGSYTDSDGDGENDSYDEEEKSSYSTSSDDGDAESEGYSEYDED